jgi:peptidoglycan/xylan/chitin deacetylase (PgdA/CDA1 family)
MFTRVMSAVARPALRRLIPGGAILSFHSITTPSLPAAGDAHVSLETFTSFIRYLRCLGEIVSLRDFVRRREQGRDTSGLIAITLDDAYAALTTEFLAVIVAEAVPVTIFPVSDATRDGEAFWWDRIDDVYPRVAPDRWAAFEKACGLPDGYRSGQPAEFGPLRPLRQWVLASCAGRWPARLEPALRAVERDAGYRTVQRSMTSDELCSLAELPGVDIGVHTMSHPVLPLLSDADLEREIAGGYAALKRWCPDVVPILAVPFGLYDARVIRAARAAGMATSLTLSGDIGHCASDRDALPRFCITRTDTCTKLALRLSGLPRRLRSRSRHARADYPALPSPTS